MNCGNLPHRNCASERPGQTLQATALVHEAYLRLVDVEQAQLMCAKPDRAELTHDTPSWVANSTSVRAGGVVAL